MKISYLSSFAAVCVFFASSVSAGVNAGGLAFLRTEFSAAKIPDLTRLHRVQDGNIRSGGELMFGDDGGCTENDLNEEATAVINAFGTQPSVPSGAWKYAYDVTKALLELTKVQAERCPDIDLSYALQYHSTNLENLERTGRAAGWL